MKILHKVFDFSLKKLWCYLVTFKENNYLFIYLIKNLKIKNKNMFGNSILIFCFIKF